MRPIKLKIKGLNSFIEEQTIDFENLTDRGLFGIFGPTGSGKSSILDGITLALYGDIARKSSNYINTNCESLNVSYRFQISGTPNRIYEVTRTFKRDKKTGNPKTHAARVIELTGGNETILAEGATSVNKECKEIIGLGLEDFTRTVVLPQGKFSEFLKLEGKQRREMLERLFNLQEYGEKLGSKLSKEMNKEKTNYNQLLGELKGYEEVSKERLDEAAKQLEGINLQLQAEKKKQQELEKVYKEKEEIWNLQEELKVYHVKAAELKAEENTINAKSQQLKRGESVQKIMPFLTAYAKTRKELTASKELHTTLKKQQDELEAERIKAENELVEITEERNKKLSTYTVVVNELKDAVMEQEAYVSAIERVKEIKQKLAGLEKQIDTSKKAVKEQEELIKTLTETSNKLQMQRDTLKIDSVLKEKVQQGLLKNQAYQTLLQNEKNTSARIEALLEKIKESKALYEENQQKQKEKLNLIETLNLQKEKLLANPPMTQEALLKQKEELVVARENWRKYGEVKQQITALNNDNKEVGSALKLIKEQKELLLKTLEEAKEKHAKLKEQNLAQELRKQLTEGGVCPVCGSREHHLEELVYAEIDEEGLKEAQQLVTKTEENYNLLQTQYAKEEAKLNQIGELLKEKMQEEEKLAAFFTEENLEQKEACFNKETDALNGYNEDKKLLEENIDRANKEKSTIDSQVIQHKTTVEESEKQLQSLKKEQEAAQQELKVLKAAMLELAETIGTDQFEAKSVEIAEAEKRREALDAQLKDCAEQKEEQNGLKEKLTQKLSQKEESRSRGQAILESQKENNKASLERIAGKLKGALEIKEEKRLSLASALQRLRLQLGVESETAETKLLVEYLSEQDQQVQVQLNRTIRDAVTSVQTVLIDLEQDYKKAAVLKEEVQTKFEKNNKNLVEVTAAVQELEKRLQEQEKEKREHLEAEQLTEDEARIYYLAEDKLEKLRKEIEFYKEQFSRLKGAIESVETKLNSRSLTKEEWEVLAERKKTLEASVEAFTEMQIKKQNEVDVLKRALEKLGELSKEKQKLEHKLAILNDLDKLFKGKRFVEFVATNRLKYISLEASKRLKSITSGHYGLEVDENGKFIIRDYKNGGAERDASTLSGGETFLASLALALALSAEIQLKGTAPLELFFLDEGFGTLDDDLLDVVMSSLEKIHHAKLKVGIISHVEAIKNRVPVKLILTPAEAGKGGTKVKLERS